MYVEIVDRAEAGALLFYEENIILKFHFQKNMSGTQMCFAA